MKHLLFLSLFVLCFSFVKAQGHSFQLSSSKQLQKIEGACCYSFISTSFHSFDEDSRTYTFTIPLSRGDFQETVIDINEAEYNHDQVSGGNYTEDRSILSLRVNYKSSSGNLFLIKYEYKLFYFKSELEKTIHQIVWYYEGGNITYFVDLE